MATPAVTLTAKLEDFIGTAVGSVANPAKMCVALCGFGPQLPRIAGTAMIARPGPIYIESTDGNISTPLWGNDVITPQNTYYTVALLDGQGNVVQCAGYQLTGSGTYDLSALTPITFPGQVLPVVINGTPQTQIAAGMIDGINKVFAFNAPGAPIPLINVFVAGDYKTGIGPSPDYALAYTASNLWTITFISAPTAGPVVVQIFNPLGASLALQGSQQWSQNVILPATSYTLPSTPSPAAPFLLFRSGLLLNQGTPPAGRYTLAGNVVTFTDSGTEFGDTLYALYWSF